MLKKFTVFLIVIFFSLSALCQQANTLKLVRNRGYLVCGVMMTLGFAEISSKGVLEGLDVEFCHAMAAAIFGDPNKVKFWVLSFVERFDLLRSGQVDILAGGNTFTLLRDAGQGLDFPIIDYHDTNGLMVHRSAHVHKAVDLNGASICVPQGTTAETYLGIWSRQNKIHVQPVMFEKQDTLHHAFMSGRCDAWIDSRVSLAAVRAVEPHPDKFVILDDELGREPTGPVVRKDDMNWLRLARWVGYSLIEGESRKIIHQVSNPTSIGFGEDLGSLLGLENLWVHNILRAVGNFGEIYDRFLGFQTGALNLPRALNRHHSEGGQMYSPPFLQAPIHAVTIQQKNIKQEVQRRGVLRCGLPSQYPSPSLGGHYCLALSAALFGDERKVEWKSANFSELYKDLSQGRIDLIGGGVPSTLGIQADLKLEIPFVSDFKFSEHQLLPEGPAVLDIDPQWIAVIRWVGQALVAAEELGISQNRANAMFESKEPSIREFLNNPILGETLGLDRRWILHAIKAVGNYGEIYDHVARANHLPHLRGKNAQFDQGGLMMALPFR